MAFGSGCRGLDTSAVNAFRAARNLAAVSSIACPTYANIDARVSKSISFKAGGKEQRVEFVAQLFNVLNRANYGVPVGNLQSAIFGQLTTLAPNINAPSRQVELAIRYGF